MIVGEVTAAREAMVRMVVQGGSGVEREIEAAIDTGFNDELTLPADLISELGLAFATPVQAALADGQIVEANCFRAMVLWDEQPRETAVLELDGTPLIGMGLLDGYRLTIDAVPAGRITIQPLSA